MGLTIFAPAPPVANEASRREAVLRSGLLIRRDDALLMRIAQDTRRMLDTSWAGVIVILDDWQHVIASSGGHIGPHRRSGCISSYVLVEPTRIFCVPDVRASARFGGSSFVEDGLIGFYAGAAIMDDGGFPVGVLCATDRKPRAGLGDCGEAILREQAGLVGASMA